MNMPDTDKRLSVRFAGESGQGINTLGELLSKALKLSNMHTFAYREYPSLIRGGVASYQIDLSSSPLNSSSKYCNILVGLDKEALSEYVKTSSKNSVVIYDKEDFVNDLQEIIKEKNLLTKYIPTEDIAEKAGGEKIMSNMVLLGSVWRILDLDIKNLEIIVRKHFENKKNIDIDAEIKCIEGGYNEELGFKLEKKIKPSQKDISGNLIISGNDSLALGLIAGGLRAYYAYPMTPATSIFKFIGSTYKETGILVKQAESEITAAQMVLGSMHAGTRAATATSGGGFDLMTETLSCAGITETPFVVILAQRAGPGTGVPTWTGAGDLTLAVNAGHGEFPRCVISVSDAESSYSTAQKALNIAEIYQLPVIILTEKQIAESLYNISSLPEDIEIERGNISADCIPYKMTGDGISPRPIPSKTNKPFLKNSDEHTEDGSSTENANDVMQMMEKRSAKMRTLEQNIPEPILYGKKDSDTVFVGWGSVKNPVIDAISENNIDASYLHFEYIYPLKTDFLRRLVENKKRMILVENNQTGELGELIKREIGFEFTDKLLKYDGRPFFVEDILDFLNK